MFDDVGAQHVRKGLVAYGQPEPRGLLDRATEQVAHVWHLGPSALHVARRDHTSADVLAAQISRMKRRRMGQVRVHRQDVLATSRAEPGQKSPSVAALPLLKHARVLAGRLLSGYEVAVRCHDQDFVLDAKRCESFTQLRKQQREVRCFLCGGNDHREVDLSARRLSDDR